MLGVMLSAFSIIGATALGAILGLFLKDVKRKHYVVITAVAAGVMLCAAVHGLLLSAIEQMSAVAVCIGVMCGAELLRWLNGWAERKCAADVHEKQRLRGLLFVFAIAIHHFPEGMAAGVSFGVGDCVETISVCTAIALQNIPETMMILPSMSGFRNNKIIAAIVISGAIETVGLLMGYFAVQMSVHLLPLFLSLAAGAMLYVILESMLTDVYEQNVIFKSEAILGGYCGMLLLTAFIEWIA